jgi:DHA2 family multidrug resistance protein
MYTTFITQSTVRAYMDVFSYVGLFALCFVPVAFFFTPAKASGGGAH